MENLMVFEGNDVKVIEINGEPMFEIYSTGSALGYSRWTTSKGKQYFKIEKTRINKVLKNAEISTLAHDGQTFMSESQLYDFMLEAKTEKCRAFRKWVVTEVIPSIRKNDGYIRDQENMTEQQIIARADSMTQKIIAEKQSKIQELEPQAKNYKLLMDSKGNIDFADFVKCAKLSEGRNTFMSRLRREKILMQNSTTPRQNYIKQGYFEVVQGVATNGYSVVKTTITKKGQDWLIKKCDKWNLLEIAN